MGFGGKNSRILGGEFRELRENSGIWGKILGFRRKILGFWDKIPGFWVRIPGFCVSQGQDGAKGERGEDGEPGETVRENSRDSPEFFGNSGNFWGEFLGFF